MRFFIVVVFICFSMQLCAFSTYDIDSVGVERVGDKLYILHQVDEKETLYSLSRRYEVGIEEIVQINPSVENGLSIGQIIKIPIQNKPLAAVPEGILHMVKPQESLYGIARKYDVDPEDIKAWNHISTSILDIGQTLRIYPELSQRDDAPASAPVAVDPDVEIHVVGQGETLYSIARASEMPLDSLRNWNELLTNDISIGDSLIVGKKQAPVVQSIESITANIFGVYDSTSAFVPEAMLIDEISESGLAQAIEGGSKKNKKYLGLHRTVPIGTVMRVHNEMNGEEVFVRIIGRLPDTGANRNIVIKLSQSAYEKLGAIDDRFRVTVSYLP